MRRRHLMLPAMCMLGLALARLWGGNYEVDTGLYAGVSWQMMQTGEWWVPHAGEVEYFKKPPLVFWIHGAVMGVLGNELWVIRLPQMFAALGVVLVCTSLVTRLSGRRVGLSAGMMLALSWPMIAHLNRFILDYWVLLFLFGAVRMIVEGVERRRIGWILGAGVLVGLSMFCKPLFGAAALPILAGYCWIRGYGFGAIASLGAILPAIVVVGPWHVWMWLERANFRVQYVGKEIAERGAGQGEFETQPVWAYLGYIGVQYQPWVWAFVFGVLAVSLAGVRRWFARLDGGVGRPPRPDRAGMVLCALWIGVWLVALSAFGDKRVRYMMHVWPMIAWVGGVWVARFVPRLHRVRLDRMAAVVGVGVLFGGFVVGVVGLASGSGPKEGWRETWGAVRALDAVGVEVWEDLENPPRGGEIYLETGVWPRPVFDWFTDERREVPVGAVVLRPARVKDEIGDGWSIEFETETVIGLRRIEAED